MVIRIETDPAKVEEQRSMSGKSIITASTGGNVQFDKWSVGLNVYHK